MKMTIPALAPLSVVWAFLCALAGCTDPGQALPAGDPQAPCVCTGDLGSCLALYKNAQICPDLSPVAFCSRYVGSNVGSPVILTNRGLQGLVVSALSLVGDDNCAYPAPQISPPLGTVIASGQTQIIEVAYAPRKQASDYAVLHITSNAENFPDLAIELCGQGVPSNTPVNSDGGVCLQCNKTTVSSKPACGGTTDGGP